MPPKAISAVLLGVSILLAHPAKADETLHPDYPIVSGQYELSSQWSVVLPLALNRRTEDKNLVLWRPGFTIWLASWGNENGDTVSQNLARIREGISPDAFGIETDVTNSLGRLSYRMRETRDGGLVHALYGFVAVPAGHLQLAFYADAEPDLELAREILRSVAYARTAPNRPAG